MNLFIIGLLLVASFVFQYFLTFIQMKSFNRDYRKLRQLGRVVIGRKKGALRAGAIVMFAIDDENKIVEGSSMQGVTVLARFKKFNGFNGIKIDTITENDCKALALSKSLTMAVLDGVLTFKTVSRGEQVPMNDSPFGKLVKKIKSI